MLPIKIEKTSADSEKGSEVFSEERRMPLSNEARDAFLKDAQSDDHTPTPAALAAAARFKAAHKK